MLSGHRNRAGYLVAVLVGDCFVVVFVLRRCPCPICNAPEPEPYCMDCRRTFVEDEEQFEDNVGNPICEDCHEKAKQG